MSGIGGKFSAMLNMDTAKDVAIDAAVIFAVSKYVVKKEVSFTDAIYYGAGVEVGKRLIGGMI